MKEEFEEDENEGIDDDASLVGSVAGSIVDGGISFGSSPKQRTHICNKWQS